MIIENVIDKSKTKGDLRRKTKLVAIFTKMENNENVSLDVLVLICIALNCGLDSIMEIKILSIRVCMRYCTIQKYSQ